MNAIVIDSVRKSFRRRPSIWPWVTRERDGILAIADISLRVPRGTVQVLLGPNGSGKTTLLKLISTMLLPDSGRVLVEGFDTQRHGKAIRKQLGYAVARERSFFPRLTARENLEFFAVLDEVPRRQRASRVLDLLNVVGLLDHAEKLVMNFSGGMYQRLGIARALLKNPSVVLMDEPSRSLDPGSAEQLRELIRKLAQAGATVLVASHNLQEAAAVADNVAVFCQGRVCGEFRTARTISSERLREFYFDCVGENDDGTTLFGTDALAPALAG
jgi:ABC-2 type transport system ATP-binding protein